MPRLFGMNIRSLLFMPASLDLQTDPISGIVEARPHRDTRASKTYRKGHRRSHSGDSAFSGMSGWLSRRSSATSRNSERRGLGSVFRRLSRDSGSSKTSSGNEHEPNAARRHVAHRVQELQLSELIMSMGWVERPSQSTHPYGSHHLDFEHHPYASSYHHTYHTQHTQHGYYHNQHAEIEAHDDPVIPRFEEEDQYIRAMPTTIKKRGALRDIDFSVLDESYAVVY